MNTSSYSIFQGLKARLLAAANKVCEEVVEEMKAACPEETGRLKSTIKGWVTMENYDIVFHFQAGNEIVDYALYVELGSSNPDYPSQPFMRPALLRLSKTAAQRIKRYM